MVEKDKKEEKSLEKYLLANWRLDVAIYSSKLFLMRQWCLKWHNLRTWIGPKMRNHLALSQSNSLSAQWFNFS